jgi:gamma-resorcylate decarboxylase
MQGKIALEEHFTIAGTLMEHLVDQTWQSRQELEERLVELDGPRLAAMDESGIDVAALSLTCPGAQGEVDADRAVAFASRVNDHLASALERHPERYVGFATIQLQDLSRAVDELDRCINRLGFRGVLLNGFTSTAEPETGRYYDHRDFDPFWAAVQELRAPVYLHPRLPLPAQMQAYADYPEMAGALWGFSVETATHALRLILGGVFERFPGVSVLLGHLGENLPFAIGRAAHRFARKPLGNELSKPLDEYFHQNFYATTSGFPSANALQATIAGMGADHVLFATDYPYESMPEAAKWFDTVELDEDVRTQIGRNNAERLLGL